LAKVFRGDHQQAGDDRDDKQQLNRMKQPREHREQDPDNDERDNDLHGAMLPRSANSGKIKEARPLLRTMWSPVEAAHHHQREIVTPQQTVL
jgi:hypothetical protein